MSTEPTEPHPGLIRRFELPTRFVHWSLAVSFLLLLLTGLTNFAPELKAIHIGGARLFAWLHVVLGFAMVVIAIGALLALWRSRSLRADLEALARTSPDDTRWLQYQLTHLGGGGSTKPEPPVAKFNAGQKLNALASAAATAGLLGTGVVLGINYFTKAVLPTLFVAQLFPLHTWLALAFIPVLLGHIYLGAIHPATREALRGMTRGVVRRDWARRHHADWIPPED